MASNTASITTAAPPAAPAQPSGAPAAPQPVAVKPSLTPVPVAPAPGVPATAPAAPGKPAEIKPPAGAARISLRHRIIALTFVLTVVLPPIAAAIYLWGFAADQYHSKVGFSIRMEEGNSPMGLLGGLAALSGGSSSSDTDILFEFIQSQKLVEEMDQELNLREIWSRPAFDPYYTLSPDAPIEDLVTYWNSMVHVTRGKGAGLLEVEVRAFTPEDATRIASRLLEKSSERINRLSDIAREDSIRFARQDLQEAEERVKAAREAVTRFRNANQSVNPEIDVQTQAGLLANLQSQLASTMIEIDLLRDSAVGANDPRLAQAERRLKVIEGRIAAERGKLSSGAEGETGKPIAELVGEYERLAIERDFAEKAHIATLAAYDAAVAESRRQSRYLAPYMEPTTAQSSLYPARLTTLLSLTLVLFLSWSVGLLIYYSVRDRR